MAIVKVSIAVFTKIPTVETSSISQPINLNINFNIILPFYGKVQRVAWFHAFRQNILYVIVHATCPIPFIVSTLSRWWFFLKSLKYEAPTYAFFTIPLLVFLCQFYTHSYAPFFQRLRKFANVRDKVHNHILLLYICSQSQTNYSVEPFREDLF
jgi:hypothetical protein